MLVCINSYHMEYIHFTIFITYKNMYIILFKNHIGSVIFSTHFILRAVVNYYQIFAFAAWQKKTRPCRNRNLTNLTVEVL